jgi:hypothetical protein
MKEKDAIREERIHNEAIIDAYGPEEQAMGWYYYLDDKISFPFEARCIAVDKRNTLEINDCVTVLKMAGEDFCAHEMYVDIYWGDKELAVPLVQVNPYGDDEDTIEAIADWHYWVEQGYIL